jgi:DNA-binding phage protein
MALTRDYKETVVARIRRDPKFARALYAEAIGAFLEGETDEGLSMLRDLVHAEITFKELARQTGLGEKTLHRMLNHNGNPTARNLGVIVKSIAEDLGVKPRVETANFYGENCPKYAPRLGAALRASLQGASRCRRRGCVKSAPFLFINPRNFYGQDS